jgi:hypothetical protein
LALAGDLYFLYTANMKPSITVHEKKRRRGRPATGQDPAVTTRLPADVLTAVEQWAESNGFKRSVAIARLVELGLKAATPKRRPAKRRSEL